MTTTTALTREQVLEQALHDIIALCLYRFHRHDPAIDQVAFIACKATDRLSEFHTVSSDRV